MSDIVNSLIKEATEEAKVEARAEGIAAGRAEGIAAGRAEALAEVLKVFNVSEEEYKALLAKQAQQ